MFQSDFNERLSGVDSAHTGDDKSGEDEEADDIESNLQNSTAKVREICDVKVKLEFRAKILHT